MRGGERRGNYKRPQNRMSLSKSIPAHSLNSIDRGGVGRGRVKGEGLVLACPSLLHREAGTQQGKANSQVCPRPGLLTCIQPVLSEFSSLGGLGKGDRERWSKSTREVKREMWGNQRGIG